MTLIVDASVAIKWFVEEEATTLVVSSLDSAEPLHAPDLLIVELTNIAWKKALRGDIDVVHAQLIAAQAQKPFAALYPVAGCTRGHSSWRLNLDIRFTTACIWLVRG